MCFHVHSRHTYCGHTVCATYPSSCASSNFSATALVCHTLDLQPTAVEHNACYKCLTKEACAKKRQNKGANNIMDTFDVTAFRGCRFWAEVRTEFTQKYIDSDPTVAPRYTTQSTEEPWGTGPQLEPYRGTGQPTLNNPNPDWVLNQESYITPEQVQPLGRADAPQALQQMPTEAVNALRIQSPPEQMPAESIDALLAQVAPPQMPPSATDALQTQSPAHQMLPSATDAPQSQSPPNQMLPSATDAQQSQNLPHQMSTEATDVPWDQSLSLLPLSCEPEQTGSELPEDWWSKYIKTDDELTEDWSLDLASQLSAFKA